MAGENETPETAPEANKENEPHVAKVGVKDTGEVVTTAHGEKIDGRITDLADGDS